MPSPKSAGETIVTSVGLFATPMRRAIAVAPLMLVALWFAFSITASTILSRSDPDLAIRLYGGNSRALERAATLESAKNTKSSANRAVALASRSLVASPLSSEGAIALAVARSTLRPQEDAMQAVRYSEFLSRRTTFTQIWMIEHSVQQGDIPAALKAYDRLFRVSDYYRSQFLPVLLRASAEADVAREMARLLATRPPWRGEYYGGLLANFPGPANFAMLVRAMRFDTKDADGAKRLELALAKLVEAGRPDLAYGIYRTAMHDRAATPRLVRNGNFSLLDGIPPFDWQLSQGDELSAELGVNEAGNSVLHLLNKGGRPGAFARQLLMLLPGRYRLDFVVGNVQGARVDRPRMTVRCTKGDVDLNTVPFPEAPEGGRAVIMDVVVPRRGCAAQWLSIEAGSPVDGIATQQWITNIGISLIVD